MLDERSEEFIQLLKDTIETESKVEEAAASATEATEQATLAEGSANASAASAELSATTANYEGEWNDVSTYVKTNMVDYEDSIYMALIDSPSKLLTPDKNKNEWVLMSTTKSKVVTHGDRTAERAIDAKQELEESILIAHRGFVQLLPENTLLAFNGALGLGVKHLECDVQVSLDGICVLIHDSTLERTTNGTGNVKDKTLAELQALDAGSHFSTKLNNTRIPTFEDFVLLAKKNNAYIYPEIKGYRTQSDIDLMIDIVVSHDMQHKTMFQSFTPANLEYVRTLNKDVKLGFLASNIVHLQTAVDTGNSYMLLSYTDVITNPTYVAQCKEVGVGIVVWTVNDYDSFKELNDIGVYAIMSDRMLKDTI